MLRSCAAKPLKARAVAVFSKQNRCCGRRFATYALSGVSPSINASAWIAPSADVMGDCHLHENASVWFNATLRGDNAPIVIGANSNIQDGSVLHTDDGVNLVIGEGCTVGHMVMLHGCRIGNNSLIGIGSVILNNCVIGDNCIIGANTLLPEGKEIPDNSLVMGAPGKVVKELNDKQVEMLRASADLYVNNAKRFSQELVLLSEA